MGDSAIRVLQVKPGVVEFDTDAGKMYAIVEAGGDNRLRRGSMDSLQER
jgi:hypothetical protein